jgi:hypothetical protein
MLVLGLLLQLLGKGNGGGNSPYPLMYSDLITYIYSYFAYISTLTDWMSDSTISDSVYDEVLDAYGVTTEALATDLALLRAWARVKCWEVITRMPNLNDGAYKLAKENLERCLKETHRSKVVTFKFNQDPYDPDYSEYF